MPRGLTILVFLLSATLLVAQDAPAPEKKVDAPKDEKDCPTDDPKEPDIDPDLEVVTPTTAPFGDPPIQEALKRTHERQSQPICFKAAITIRRSNPMIRKPATTSTGTIYGKRTANGHMRILWEEPGSRVIVMNNSSTYLKWEGGKEAFEFPHRKREKYFAAFPLLFGATKPFLDQFDFDFFSVPSAKILAESPTSGDAPPPPTTPVDRTTPDPNPNAPPVEIRDVIPPPGVSDPPVRAEPGLNHADLDVPSSSNEYIVRLIPRIGAKPGGAPYVASLNNTTIWINTGTLAVTRIALVETNGERTEMTLDKVETPADIPEITFTRPLDGVRIIEAK